MSPLATLWRHETIVVLDYGFAQTTAGATPMVRVEFRATTDAVVYLRFWKRDAGAMAGLRSALARYRQGPIARMSDDQVIDALAVHLAHGELMSASGDARLAVTDTAPLTGTQSAAAAAAAAPPAAISIAAPPVLPQLETVQIEGAMVLPEVMETLEQLDLTMAHVDVATVSLAPTPSGVSAVSTELTSASSSITATLDDL